MALTHDAALPQGGTMLSFTLLDLSLAEIVTDIPHDAGAVVVYVLLALFVGMTWAGSRRRPRGGAGVR